MGFASIQSISLCLNVIDHHPLWPLIESYSKIQPPNNTEVQQISHNVLSSLLQLLLNSYIIYIHEKFQNWTSYFPCLNCFFFFLCLFACFFFCLFFLSCWAMSVGKKSSKFLSIEGYSLWWHRFQICAQSLLRDSQQFFPKNKGLAKPRVERKKEGGRSIQRIMNCYYAIEGQWE